ncbi:MAG: ABC transporter ATP-binding protein [Alkaliphilus sp.]
MNELTTSIKRVIQLCLTESNKIVLSIIFSIISFTISIVPYYMVYRVLLEISSAHFDAGNIRTYSIIAVLAIIIKIIFFSIATTLSHKAAYEILHKLRIKMASKLLSLPLGYFVNKELGATKKTINEDVEKLELYIAHNIPEIIGALVSPIVTTIFIFFMNWQMAIATITIIPLVFISYGLTFNGSNQIMSNFQNSLLKMNAAIIEYVNGMQVIKSFSLTASSYKKLSEAFIEYSDSQRAWGKSAYKYFNLSEVLIISGILIIFPTGMFLFLYGNLSLEMFILFLLLGLGYSQPLMKLIMFMYTGSQIAKGEAEIHELLSENSLPETTNPQIPTSCAIEFSNVAFAYEKRQILNNVSFTARQNEITALVGSSGAGKTTIARLIPRFWDVNSGEITIGGVDIRNMSSSKLMDMISFVFQDVFLFNLSIKDNIRFGKNDATDDEIIAAAKVAQCHDFIASFPDGYDTFAGQRGTKLSGGEKQRISLARAILKDAPIIIFDEATSAADPENEDKIQEAVSKLIKNKTVIVIAHNLSTIVDTNQILLIKDGHVAESGTHLELLDTSKTYRNMWETHIKSNETIISEAS